MFYERKKVQKDLIFYSYLIGTGLGSAPVQQHLFDGVGIGDTKACGALHLVYLSNGWVATVRKINAVEQLVFLSAKWAWKVCENHRLTLQSLQCSRASRSWLFVPVLQMFWVTSEPSSAPISLPVCAQKLMFCWSYEMCCPHGQKHWRKQRGKVYKKEHITE